MELVLLLALMYAGARAWEHAATAVRHQRTEEDAAKAAKRDDRTVPANDKTAAKKKPPQAEPDPPEVRTPAVEVSPAAAGVGARTAGRIATVRVSVTRGPEAFREGFKLAWPTAKEMARQRMAAAAREAEWERWSKDLAAKEAAKAPAVEPNAKPVPPKPAGPPPVPPTPTPPASDALRRPEPETPRLRLVKDNAAKPAPPAAAPDDLDIPDFLKPPMPVPLPAPATGRDSKENPLIARIGDVRTHEQLIAALKIVREDALHSQEEAVGIEKRSADSANALDHIEEEMAAIGLDGQSLAEINHLREVVSAQAEAGAAYHTAAEEAGTAAEMTARNVENRHGAVAEAAAASSVPMVKDTAYYQGD